MRINQNVHPYTLPKVGSTIKLPSDVNPAGYEIFDIETMRYTFNGDYNDMEYFVRLSAPYTGGRAEMPTVSYLTTISGQPWSVPSGAYMGIGRELSPYVYPGEQVWAWPINALRQAFEMLEMHVHRIEGDYYDLQGYTQITSYVATRVSAGRKSKQWYSGAKRSKKYKTVIKAVTTIDGGREIPRTVDMEWDPGQAFREPSLRLVQTGYVDGLPAAERFNKTVASGLTGDQLDYIYGGQSAYASGSAWFIRQNVGVAGNASATIPCPSPTGTLQQCMDIFNATVPPHLWVGVDYDVDVLPTNIVGRINESGFYDLETGATVSWSGYWVSGKLGGFTGGLDPHPGTYAFYVGDQGCNLPTMEGNPSTWWTGSTGIQISNGEINKSCARLLASGDNVSCNHINELRSALEAFEKHTHRVTLSLIDSGVEGVEPQIVTIEVETRPPDTTEPGYGLPSSFYGTGKRVDGTSPIKATDINDIAAGVMWLYRHTHRIDFNFQDLVKHQPAP